MLLYTVHWVWTCRESPKVVYTTANHSNPLGGSRAQACAVEPRAGPESARQLPTAEPTRTTLGHPTEARNRSGAVPADTPHPISTPSECPDHFRASTKSRWARVGPRSKNALKTPNGSEMPQCAKPVHADLLFASTALPS